MKMFCFKILALLLTLAFASNACKTDDNVDNPDNPEKEDVSIIGQWQMYGTTKYGLTFTNYGIVKWKHLPYMPSNLSYTYSGTTLTVSGINGTGIFLDEGNTLEINGFSEPSSFGSVGATGPFVNSTYIRQ